MSFKSKFDPESERAIRGLQFQSNVQLALSSLFQNALNTREWLLRLDPFLNDIQLNVLEHTWGDIVIFDDSIPHPIFIECVNLKGEKSIFPNHKMLKYNGENKYYCFGWDDEMRFVHSLTWNKYVSKCKALKHYKLFSRHIIKSLKRQHDCASNFCEAIIRHKNV